MVFFGIGDIWVNKRMEGFCWIFICFDGGIKFIDIYDYEKIGLN